MIMRKVFQLLFWGIGLWRMTYAWSFATFQSSPSQNKLHRQARWITPSNCLSLPSAADSATAWGRRRIAETRRAASSTPAIEESAVSAEVCDGDVVVVFGATGKLGRLVAQSLAAMGKYKVRGVVRNLEKAETALSGAKGLEIAQGNIMDRGSLGDAVKNAACIVLCTGTPAFPSARWSGGNTPDAVDNLAVENVVQAAVDAANHPDGGKLKRIVYLSSIGVERKNAFPFVFLNTFGVLDAKVKGEEIVKTAAQANGFSYTIVRPGRFSGEPFTIFKDGVPTPAPEPEKPDKNASKRMVSLCLGDKEAGDANRSSVAAAFAQAVQQPGAANKIFTVINVEGPDPSEEVWDDLYSKL